MNLCVVIWLVAFVVCDHHSSYDYCMDVGDVEPEYMKYCNPDFTDSDCCRCEGDETRRCKSMDDNKYYTCCPCTAWIDDHSDVAKCDCSMEFVAQNNGGVKQVDYTDGFENEVVEGSSERYKFYCTHLNASDDLMPYVQDLGNWKMTWIQWIVMGACATFFCVNFWVCLVGCVCFWSFECCPNACSWISMVCGISGIVYKKRKKVSEKRKKKKDKQKREKEKKKGREKRSGDRQKRNDDKKDYYSDEYYDYSEDYSDDYDRDRRY